MVTQFTQKCFSEDRQMPLHAKEDVMCVVCEITIQSGENTRPLTSLVSTSEVKTACTKEPLQWAHVHCVDQYDDRVPVCKHWKKAAGI